MQKLHVVQGLVTNDIYRYIRHPQYTGISGFAKREEATVIAGFGDACLEYARTTPRFLPGLYRRR